MAKSGKGGLSKTTPSKGSFNKAVAKNRKTFKRNYSQREVIQKTDRYAAYGKGIHKAKMLDIKDKYLKHYTNNLAKRGRQDMELRDGIKEGFQPRNAIEKVDRNRTIADQYNRNLTVERAKNYYHRNYSMSKDFSKVNGKDKIIDKGKG